MIRKTKVIRKRGTAITRMAASRNHGTVEVHGVPVLAVLHILISIKMLLEKRRLSIKVNKDFGVSCGEMTVIVSFGVSFR